MDWSALLMNEYVWMAVTGAVGWVWGKVSGKKYAKDALDWALPLAELIASKTATQVDDRAVNAIKAGVSKLPEAKKRELRDMLALPPRLP